MASPGVRHRKCRRVSQDNIFDCCVENAVVLTECQLLAAIILLFSHDSHVMIKLISKDWGS